MPAPVNATHFYQRITISHSSPETTTSVRIGGEEIPIAAVRERLGQLDRFHITYVLDCMQKISTPIRNIRAYLLAALYQAPTTIDSYYRAAVRADCGR